VLLLRLRRLAFQFLLLLIDQLLAGLFGALLEALGEFLLGVLGRSLGKAWSIISLGKTGERNFNRHGLALPHDHHQVELLALAHGGDELIGHGGLGDASRRVLLLARN